MTMQEVINRFNTTPFLFAGSGLSRRYLGLPDWEGLLTQFAQKVREDAFAFQYYESQVVNAAPSDRLPAIASLIEKEYNALWFSDAPGIRSNSTAVFEAVKKHCSPFKAELAEYILSASTSSIYSEELEALKRCSVRSLSGVITTNYDCLFETLFDGYKTFVGQGELVFSQLQGIAEIYKIHGSVTRPESIVINQEDYTAFRSKGKYLAAKLMTIFMEYPIIFIGYSISDPNIQEILSDIVECMPGEKVKVLRDRFVFVEYNALTDKAIISGHSMVIRDKVIEMTKIELHDFTLLYDALCSKKAAVPVKILRRFKDDIYRYALSNKPGPTMQVAALDDQRIDEETLILSIGLAKTGEYGLKRAVDASHWYRNVVLHDSPYGVDVLLQIVYPDLLKTNSGKLPVWYYLANANSQSELAASRAPKQYSEIVNEISIKHNITAAADRCIKQIWDEEKDNLGRALRIMSALPEERVNSEDLGTILRELFDKDYEIVSSLSANNRSAFKKLIRIFDYITYSDVRKTS